MIVIKKIKDNNVLVKNNIFVVQDFKVWKLKSQKETKLSKVEKNNKIVSCRNKYNYHKTTFGDKAAHSGTK